MLKLIHFVYKTLYGVRSSVRRANNPVFDPHRPVGTIEMVRLPHSSVSGKQNTVDIELTSSSATSPMQMRLVE